MSPPPPHLAAPALATLTALAQDLVACPQLWAPVLEHHADQRIHTRLAALDTWEAWLITWPSGHGVEVHDHGDAAGAVAVVGGELTELVARRASGRLTGDLARRTLPTGTVRRVPTGQIHDVLNLGSRPATSIHVYGPSLTTMTFYDDALRPTRTERVYPEEPRLDPATVRAALGSSLPG